MYFLSSDCLISHALYRQRAVFGRSRHEVYISPHIGTAPALEFEYKVDASDGTPVFSFQLTVDWQPSALLAVFHPFSIMDHIIRAVHGGCKGHGDEEYDEYDEDEYDEYDEDEDEGYGNISLEDACSFHDLLVHFLRYAHRISKKSTFISFLYEESDDFLIASVYASELSWSLSIYLYMPVRIGDEEVEVDLIDEYGRLIETYAFSLDEWEALVSEGDYGDFLEVVNEYAQPIQYFLLQD